MGKNLIQQARGKGGPTYRAPSFRYVDSAKLKSLPKEEASAITQGKIMDFIKCPGHSAPLAKVSYSDGETIFTIAAEGMKVGDAVTDGPGSEIRTGNTMPLSAVPIGTLVYNIESNPGDGGKFCRASGTFAKVIGKTKDNVVIELPSKKERSFKAGCRASVGVIAGGGRLEKPFVKAGRMYHKMRAKNKLYPRVCGQSMNAVDHPHGGSRSSKKNYPYTVSRNLPPGAKVGKISSKRTGRKKR